jgi:amino acid adenylation domain-containing protein
VPETVSVKVPESASASLCVLFRDVVRRSADRTALVSGDRRTTYAELDAASDDVARALLRRGAGPGVPVGVHMDRSTALFEVVLGVLKTGGCVVPLNPEHPPAVLRHIVEESGAGLVVADDAAAVDRLGTGARPVGAAALVAEPGDASPPVPDDPGSTAFVLFTSGSTGRPKGVRITHRGLARLGDGGGPLAVTEDDCLVQMAAFSFAASTIEIWLALLRGARLVVMPPGLPSLPVLRDAVLAHGVTVLSLPCGLFHLLVDNEIECLAGLRAILLSGDFVSARHLAAAAAATRATIFNGYGCTENSSITAVHPVRGPEDVDAAGRVPVGRALPEVTVEVLDEHLAPCPPEQVGELCVGGAGVAGGYLHRPELTAEKFVPHPDRPGDVLYRTGDLARTTPDGDVVLIGRADSMVKIRGYRVETTAVELAVATHPAVVKAVVLAFANDRGEKSLTAFYTTTDGAPVPAAELTAHLGDRLARYEVPSTFVPLREFPVNANGKIDRSALHDPTTTGGDPDMTNPLETVVLQTWKDISHDQEFTTTDSFLGHGGNSLHFVQLASSLQKVFDVEIQTEDVFRHGTVEQLAAHVQQLRDERAGTPS